MQHNFLVKKSLVKLLIIMFVIKNGFDKNALLLFFLDYSMKVIPENELIVILHSLLFY